MKTDTLGIGLATPSTPRHSFISRPAMTRLASLAFAACAALLIAACGGGGGGGPATTATADTAATVAADASDKYTGPWGRCDTDGTTSFLSVLTFAKVDANRASFTLTGTGFANTTCTAPAATPTFTIDGIFAIDGQATVQSKVVDKVTVTPTGAPSVKDIAFTDGNQLQFGDAASPPDAEGYPTALDTTFVLTRR